MTHSDIRRDHLRVRIWAKSGSSAISVQLEPAFRVCGIGIKKAFIKPFNTDADLITGKGRFLKQQVGQRHGRNASPVPAPGCGSADIRSRSTATFPIVRCPFPSRS
jgi:hypothetical protein